MQANSNAYTVVLTSCGRSELCAILGDGAGSSGGVLAGVGVLNTVFEPDAFNNFWQLIFAH